MLKLDHIAKAGNTHLSYSSFHSEEQRGFVLLTYHQSTGSFWDDIDQYILNAINDIRILDISRSKIETTLRACFVDLNWKLAAKFRHLEPHQRGISLYLTIIYGNDIYVIQFGRILGAVLHKRELLQVGSQWEHFHVKSMEDLSLLGQQETDIKVRIDKLTLGPKDKFIAISSQWGKLILEQKISAYAISDNILSWDEEASFPYALLSFESMPKKYSNNNSSRLRTSLIILIALIIIATVYTLFGNRFLEVEYQRFKTLFRSKTDITTIPLRIKIQSPAFEQGLERIEKMAFAPARDIRFKLGWEKPLEDIVTISPSFDIEHVYLASNMTVRAISKADRHVDWSHTFDDVIQRIQVTSNDNLLIHTMKGKLYYCKSNGEQIWKEDVGNDSTAVGKDDCLDPIEIGYDADPRLNSSIVIIPGKYKIQAINLANGQILSEIVLSWPISYISGYDEMKSCFYVITGNKLLQLDMQIKNW